MKRKVLKIGALIAALLLIIGVCWFANGLVGNPVSKALARNTAEKHLEKNYGDKDFVIEDVNFSFKDGYYHVHVGSPSSIDSSFSLTIDMLGKLRYDYYEDNVLNGWNTATRIGNDYRAVVDKVLDSGSFPYEVDIGYGDILFAPADQEVGEEMPEYAIPTNELVLDGYYDLRELGERAGELTLYICDGDVTVGRLAEILLDVKRIFDDAGVAFCTVDCVLKYPRNDDGTHREGRVEVMHMPYTDIYEEGMAERVKASNDEAIAYYAEQDKEKFKEKE